MTTKRAAPAPAGGYTLIELLTTLAIAGVLLSVAAPSLADLVRGDRRSTAVTTLLRTLKVARTEAVTRNRTLVICGLDDADGDRQLALDERRCTGRDWTDGWLLGTWDDRNANGIVEGAEVGVLHVFQPPAEVTVRAGNFVNAPNVQPPGTIVVRPAGRRSSNGTLTVCDSRGPSEARGVIISSTGRARVSSKRSDGRPLACP